MNFFNYIVKILCDVVSEVIFFEGVVVGGGLNFKWEYEIDFVMDVDMMYFLWICEFEVFGMEL